jgi:microcystin-dependent protein
MDSLIGEIKIWPLNWAPDGYLFCNGQLLSIQQNTALFALIGVTYGGNGTTTFALPNLNGRIPVGADPSTHLLGKTLGDTTK